MGKLASFEWISAVYFLPTISGASISRAAALLWILCLFCTTRPPLIHIVPHRGTFILDIL